MTTDSIPADRVTFRDGDGTIRLQFTSSIDPTSEALGAVEDLILQALIAFKGRQGATADAIIEDLTRER